MIGTFNTEWSYILQDGVGSMRQLAKPDGAVALSVSYTPWGDTLEVYGTGMLDIGYLGGVYDAGTGLIYMGNGQYYDPSTGRFLTRGMKEESTNPYTPWSSDPSGMLIAPLALLALVFGRKKNRTKLDHFVILVVIGLSVGLSVSAFAWAPTSYLQTPVPGGTQPPTSTSQPDLPTTHTSTPMPFKDDNTRPTPIFEPIETPEIDDCSSSSIGNSTNDFGFEMAKLLLSINIPTGVRLAQYLGYSPDYRGIVIAAYYKEEIEKYANLYPRVNSMMVANGIAIQGNYSGNIVDIGQELWIRIPGTSSDSTAFGIGGFTEQQLLDIVQNNTDPVKAGKEIEELLENDLDPRNDKIAIWAMINRIDRVLIQEDVLRCSETDKMIFAAIAQQNQNYNPNDVFNKGGNTQYYKEKADGTYWVNWGGYFDFTYEASLASHKNVRNHYHNWLVAGGMDFQTKFMLKRAVNNMQIFMLFDIFDLPEGVEYWKMWLLVNE